MRAYYIAHKEERKAYYNAHKAQRNAADKNYFATHRSVRLLYFRKYHCCTKRVKLTKATYSLAQPTQHVIEKYFRCAQANLLADGSMKTKLLQQFESQQLGVARKSSTKDLGSAVVRLAAKKLVARSLQLRRKYAGFLLNTIKLVKSIQLKTRDDFGKGCHTQTTEPYFYEAAYQYVRESPSLSMSMVNVLLPTRLHLGKRNLIPLVQVASRCPQGVSQTLNLIRNLLTAKRGNALNTANDLVTL